MFESFRDFAFKNIFKTFFVSGVLSRPSFARLKKTLLSVITVKLRKVH